jgi:hypothetical protein
MVYTLFLSTALLGTALGDDNNPPASKMAERSAYELAESHAGRDANAHVKLALWCESHGLSAERMKHLALAVLNDPANSLARGLMGLVSYKGKWGRPEAIGREIQRDPEYRELLREYLDRRARTPAKPDAQLKLADWCDQKGLKEQALAHYNDVIRMDPSHDTAWRHLGFKKQAGRWVKPDELAAAKLEGERQKHADKQWKTKLERLHEGLESRDPARRAKAERALTEVTDPRAVPMIWAVFLRGSERSQVAAVQMLGQIAGPGASRALVVLAVFNPSATVRGRASETLLRRDPREVVDRLIGLLRKPLKYQVRPVNGPGSTGALYLEGERFNLQRLYQSAPVDPSWFQNRVFTPSVPFDPFSLPNLMMAAFTNGVDVNGLPNPALPGSVSSSAVNPAQLGHALSANPQHAQTLLRNLGASASNAPINPTSSLALSTWALAAQRDLQIGLALESLRQTNEALQRNLATDLQLVETANDQIKLLDGRVLPMLNALTGEDFGSEPEKWKSWWTDQLGYAYKSDVPATKPTYTDVQMAEAPPSLRPVQFGGEWVPVHSCFGVGTLVQTVDGSRAIESLQTGDRVLSQNTSTGALEFEPVVAVYHNRPAHTLHITTDGDAIIATGIHRFWKAGIGWTMARELRPGDRIRTIGGIALVKSVETASVQPVFNVEVARNRDFFVGAHGTLVHDNSLVQPVLGPFDRASDLNN